MDLVQKLTILDLELVNERYRYKANIRSQRCQYRIFKKYKFLKIIYRKISNISLAYTKNVKNVS